MIAALYARVSTGRQENEATIESQLDEIKARIKQDGNVLPEKLIFIDDGWTSEMLRRPDLDRLRDAVQAKLFEVLYLYDFGRLSRVFVYQAILKNEIIEAGIKMITLHDINGDTPEQLFSQNVMGLFHDYERVKIAERFRRGKLYKAKNGILFGWQAPFGYRYVKGDHTTPGKFEIVPYEAQIVKKIFTWIGKDGHTIRQVIKKLYDENITPRKSKNNYWSTSTLSKRLRDETYIGITYYNKTQAVVAKNPLKNVIYRKVKRSSRIIKNRNYWLAINVPKIIDKSLFDDVQKQLVKNDRFAIRNKKNKYLVANVIDCTCGSTRAGEGVSGTNSLYYRCTDYVRRFPLPKQCFNKGVNAVVLDKLVWEKLTSLLSKPSIVKKYYEQWKNEKLSTYNSANVIDQKIEHEISSLNNQEKRYLKAYGTGVITLEQYKEQSSSIKVKIEAYTSKLRPKNVDLQSKTIEIPDYETVYDKINSTLDDYDFEKRRSVVKKLVTNIVTDGKTATMTGLLPIETNENNKNVEFKTFNRNRRSAKCR